MLRKGHVPLLAIALAACTVKVDGDDELAEESGDTETETDSDTGGESETSPGTDATDSAGDSDDADDDEAGDDVEEEGEGESVDDGPDDDTSDTLGDNCEFGDYIEYPAPAYDEEAVSGSVFHSASRGVFESTHGVGAQFVDTLRPEDDGLLCVEWVVGEGDPAVDECSVFYSQGNGVGGELVADFVNLAVSEVTFDVGDGPVALELWPGNDLNPDRYHASLSPLPDVPFGGTASLAVDFVALPDVDLDLDVPEDLMPITPAYGATMLSSAQLASWTWSNSGGAEPVEIEVSIGATPYGSGWSEWVQIRCSVTDDGEFAFPVEYFDLARERLGPVIHAGASIGRGAGGQEPFNGEQLIWRSSNTVSLGVEIVD